MVVTRYSFTKAATWKACTSASWPDAFWSRQAAKRRVAFRYALRVWSLLTSRCADGRGRTGGGGNQDILLFPWAKEANNGISGWSF